MREFIEDRPDDYIDDFDEFDDDIFDDIAECTLCGEYYCTCCGCDCYLYCEQCNNYTEDCSCEEGIE